MTGTRSEVVVVEGVWGEPFEALARNYSLLRRPDALVESDDLGEVLAAARALVVRNRTRVGPELLAAAPRLEVVGRAGVGLDNVDVAAADALGVVVVVPLGVNATSVAEHTLALALALLRDVPAHDRAVRAASWVRKPARELSGRSWGLLGAGATGLAVARLAAAFGMRVLAYDPYVDAAAARQAGVHVSDLDTLLGSVDVLSVHLPATPETQHLLGSRAFARMRPGCLVVNVGRGEAIDETALADALASGQVGGAGLDVRAKEPPGPGPLDAAPNVLFTPHIAGITVESQQRIATILAGDIAAVLGGGEAAHAVGAHRRATRVAPVEHQADGGPGHEG